MNTSEHSESRRHSSKPDDSSRKLFVASLSYETTVDELKGLFSTCGRVTDCHVAKDKETGSSRGFAFVTFETEESANDALTELDGVELGGRTIKVSISRPHGEGDGKGKGSQVVAGHGVGEEVNVAAYKIERISDEQQRVVIRKSRWPTEMRGVSAEDTFVYSDDDEAVADDPEAAFVSSLSTKEKHRLLKKLSAEGGGDADNEIKKKKKSKKSNSREKKKKDKKKKKKKKTSSSSSSSSSSESESESKAKRSKNEPVLFAWLPDEPAPAAPEDWACPKCSNMNWARRLECFRCKHPKPKGK